MLAHDKPIVSGVYRQRLEPQMIELYDLNMRRLDVSQLTGTLQEIGGCGFGCVLVKKEVFSNRIINRSLCFWLRLFLVSDCYGLIKNSSRTKLSFDLNKC